MWRKSLSKATALFGLTPAPASSSLASVTGYGCFDTEGMAKLRKGHAPTITKGPYSGELATVDHILPRSVVPELDNRLYNLQFMPEPLNQSKGATIGPEELRLARELERMSLLSSEGLHAVERACQ